MPERAKSVKILKMEGKSHRTKKELAMRERMETANLTGSKLREEKQVRENPAAHKEFTRVRKLLRLIEKDDELYGAEINLYCQLKAEIEQEETERKRLYDRLETIRRMEEQAETFEDMKAVLDLQNKVKQQIAACDRNIRERRKMRLDIENKNLMNIASSLRSIPKTADKKSNPLKEALGS